MHPKIATNLLAPLQNVPTAAAITPPIFQVALDINNNSSITNGQPVNNVKCAPQDPHCLHFENSKLNFQRSKPSLLA